MYPLLSDLSPFRGFLLCHPICARRWPDLGHPDVRQLGPTSEQDGPGARARNVRMVLSDPGCTDVPAMVAHLPKTVCNFTPEIRPQKCRRFLGQAVLKCYWLLGETELLLKDSSSNMQTDSGPENADALGPLYNQDPNITTYGNRHYDIWKSACWDDGC